MTIQPIFLNYHPRFQWMKDLYSPDLSNLQQDIKVEVALIHNIKSREHFKIESMPNKSKFKAFSKFTVCQDWVQQKLFLVKETLDQQSVEFSNWFPEEP